MPRPGILLLLLACLGACGTARTPDTRCPGLSPVPLAAPAGTDPAGASRVAALPEGTLAADLSVLFPPATAGLTAEEPVRILALSTGGIWAAFGSGFVEGWGRNGRPEFDVVTGASAGATVAPAAFAGRDDLLPFPNADAEGLATPRFPLALLFANSVYEAEGLERASRRLAPDDLMAAIREARAEGRFLLIGAVNLGSGEFEVFDVGAYLARPEARAACVSELVLASAAIPVVLPPRRIEGALYADAGLREHVFLREVAAARGASGRPVEVSLIVNGDLGADLAAGAPRSEGLIPLAGRAAGIATDQGMRQSILNLLAFAGERGWTVRAFTGRGVPKPDCGGGSRGLFDQCTADALHAAGRRLGESHAPEDWLDERDLRALLRGT